LLGLAKGLGLLSGTDNLNGTRYFLKPVKGKGKRD